MSKFRIWATDCDGPGNVWYAPLFDSEEKAQAWIDDFDNSDGEIRRMWIEEEAPLYHEVYGEYEGETE
jgi:hypothetical protein